MQTYILMLDGLENNIIRQIIKNYNKTQLRCGLYISEKSRNTKQ